MKIVEDKSTNINKNIKLYNCLNDRNEIIGNVKIQIYENEVKEDSNVDWNVWIINTCKGLNDYYELKNNDSIRKELMKKIKEYIIEHKKVGQENRAIIVMYPIGDNDEIKKVMNQDIMQEYSLFPKNKEAIEIFEFEISNEVLYGREKV